MMNATLATREPTNRLAPIARPRVAYIMSRFPKLTETFVLYEILALERQGVDVQIYPLQRAVEAVMHADAAALVARARYLPWLSWQIVRSHAYFLVRKPLVYLAALARLLWANLGSLRYFGGALAFFPKAVHIARCLQRDSVRHVHAHFASHPAAVAWLISRLTGIPYSFTAHGSDLHRDQHMLREKVAAAAFVVAISDYNRHFMLDRCGRSVAHKLRVVRCGVDTSVFQTGDQRGRNHGGAAPLQIVCVGTLHEVKGQKHLIDACRLLAARGIDAECHLVGDGPDRQPLSQQAAEAGLINRIHFWGARTRPQVVEILRRADVVAAPSVPTRCGRREGIPVSLMEAMAAGVPVVASRLSGIPELVLDDQTGLLAPAGDAPALADALARLASDAELRQRLATAARRKIEQDFDLQRNAGRLASYFTGPQAQ